MCYLFDEKISGRRLCCERDACLQEFERDFPHLPRPDLSRGRRWNEDEGRRFADIPDEEGGFRRHPRDELEFRGPGDERFLREREFGRPREFDDERRFPDDRRPLSEWEHDDPLHPAYRFLLLLFYAHFNVGCSISRIKFFFVVFFLIYIFTGFPLTWKTWKTPKILLTWKTPGRLLEFYVRPEIFGIISRFMLVLTL